MSDHEASAKMLFQSYGRLNDEAMRRELSDDEMNELASMFADFTVGSSPQGVIGAASSDLPPYLKGAQANYRRVGGKRFGITDVRISDIDDIHAECRVDWNFAYVNKSGQSGNVRFTNIYYLSFAGGTPKIFAFITPDETKAMREHGLA